MKENTLREKSYQFALRIVRLCRYLSDEKQEYVLSKQILVSGTSIGAFVEEAQQGENRGDFVHQLAVANKQAFRTNFWLRLLRDSGYLSDKQSESLLEDCDELQRMLVSALKTTRKKLAG